MRLIARWINASLIILTAICAVTAQQKTTKSAEVTPQGVSVAEWRQLLTVLIHTPSGQQLGSGVLVAEASGGLWVASNRHVLADQSTVCVVKADRKAAAALVVPLQSQQKNRELDLALIWLPHVEQGSANVAGLSEKAIEARGLPLVMATGFPTSISGTSIDGPTYSERPGLLVPLLSEPIQDGLDLAYTSLIEKGMSGGGVFLGSELIGINSAHRDPLGPVNGEMKRGNQYLKSSTRSWTSYRWDSP